MAEGNQEKNPNQFSQNRDLNSELSKTNPVWRISIGAVLCALKNIITDTSQLAGAGVRASSFNRCNDATVTTSEIPLVHASCDIITLWSTRSRFTQQFV